MNNCDKLHSMIFFEEEACPICSILKDIDSDHMALIRTIKDLQSIVKDKDEYIKLVLSKLYNAQDIEEDIKIIKTSQITIGEMIYKSMEAQKALSDQNIERFDKIDAKLEELDSDISAIDTK